MCCQESCQPKLSQSFWCYEMEKELQKIGLREEWMFADQKGELSGSNDHAMEYIDSHRCDNLYSHTCYANCKSKGKLARLQH